MAIFGISAGGHLVSLLGTSQGVEELDGRVGTAAEATRTAVPPVAGVINFCGVTDFLTFPGKGSQAGADIKGQAICGGRRDFSTKSIELVEFFNF